ncbi:MAG: transporter [Pseudomonadota bacterium]
MYSKIAPVRRTRFHALSIAGALAALCAFPAHADDKDQIVTDRPDFVEGSNVVGAGRLQIETGLAWDRNAAQGVKERATYTPTLLRYGISDTLEVRLETDGRLQRTTSEGPLRLRERGYGDVSLGVKWHAMDAVGNKPSVGVLVHADLESGSSAFRGDGIRPSVRVAAEWEFENGMSMGIMPGLVYQRGEQGGVSGMFGITFGKPITETLTSFFELSSPQIARSRRGGTEAVFTTGLAYLLTNTVQLDTALSRGLNSRTTDYSFTIGISVKL